MYSYFAFGLGIQSDFPLPAFTAAEVEGDVFIHGINITNLDGLNSLTHIGGDLSIGRFVVGHGNLNLNDLSGINHLNSIGGNLTIAQNDLLTSLFGLDTLSSINGSLRLLAE